MKLLSVFRRYLQTLAFMSILPLGGSKGLGPHDFGRFPALYPMVGASLGLISLILWLILSRLDLPDMLIALLLVVSLIITTRGFHLDGLADAADALLSHKPIEQKLAIMKDSHQGTFGVLAIVLDILLKFILILCFIQKGLSPIAFLILWPLWGRLSCSVVAVYSDYARPEGGLGGWMVIHSTKKDLAFAAASSLIMSAVFGPPAFLTTLFALILGALLVPIWKKCLGGVTGDLLGSTIELGEISSMIFFIAII